MRRLLEYTQQMRERQARQTSSFQNHVLVSLGEIKETVGEVKGRQSGVIDTLNSHSHILRQHTRDIAKIRAGKRQKDGSIWADMALQLWSKVIIGTVLLALAALTNLSPEKAAQLFQAVFGK